MMKHNLSWKELKNSHEKEILLKGFLYKADSQWVLTEKPSLKTCCVLKEEHKVFISPKDSDLEVSPHVVICFQGVLSDLESGGFVLEQAERVTATTHFPVYSCIFFLVCCGWTAWKYYRKVQTSTASSSLKR